MKLMPAQPGDIPELVRISKAAFESDVAVGSPAPGGPPEYDDPAWHEEMCSEGRLFTACESSRIVGGAILFVDEGSKWHMYIGRIFIDPAEFGKGLGAALMGCIEELFPEVTVFTLDTPEWNIRTNRFYRKLGYAQISSDAGEVRYQKTKHPASEDKKNMDFGMPTLIGCASPEESAALCRRLGLKFVELNMNLPEYQPDRLESVLKNRPSDIYYTLHMDENLNPFDFNPAVAAAWQETALKTIGLARSYDVPVVNMHFPMGVYFTLPDRKAYLFDEYWPDVARRICSFRDAVAAIAGDVRICIENTVFGGFAHLTDALELLLEAPCFQLTYDCGHDHTDGLLARSFYESRADRLIHFHLHDHHGKKAHLTLGSGDMELDSMLRMAENCRVVIEVKDIPGLIASVRILSERNLL